MTNESTSTPVPSPFPSEECQVGEWAGYPHYVCKLCVFDTLAELAMLTHLVNEHGSEGVLAALIALEEQQSAQTQVVDHAGQSDGETHVAAVIALSDDDVQELLNQSEGEEDGTTNPN